MILAWASPFKQYFCLFADHLGCTDVVQAYEPLAFLNKNSDYFVHVK